LHRNAAVLVVAALVLAACAAPARIESRKAAEYAKEPKRVFVMTDIGTEWGNDYYKAFQRKFTAALQQCGATVQMGHISGLELDESVHLKRARAFNADTVLAIRRNGGTKNQYGAITDVIYDSRLLDVQTNKMVWRSSAKFIRGLTPISDRGEELALDIAQKLHQDGILRSCPPPKTQS
jgi:hypothetical protein